MNRLAPARGFARALILGLGLAVGVGGCGSSGPAAAPAAPTAPSRARPPEPPRARHAAPAAASDRELRSLFDYIDRSWDTLTRTHAQLPQAAVDPKLPGRSSYPVYVSRRENLAAVRRRLERELGPAGMKTIELRRLPADRGRLTEQGLLYLPEPYVVPGGKFNEMYGWDSYWILLGLLADDKVDLARSMVDDFVYQVENYGMVLNANRTYYLTRSQPPVLTRMILAVYGRTHDRAWLRRTLPAIRAYYAYWTRPPHLTPRTGLSRYHDLGHGPAPEVIADAAHDSYYQHVIDYFKTHTITDYDVSRFYDAKTGTLTDLFYVADRSMRESGFDPSERFGPFNAGVIFMNPVGLNSLLYAMELDTAAICHELRTGNPGLWSQRAAARKRAINRYLWDPDRGMYLDYNVESRTRRDYPFGTMFFPLWAGLASPAQAAKVVAHLDLLEQPGGVAASNHVSGTQWDKPWGWAPLVWVAAKGLRRYGYGDAADRISINWLSLLLGQYLAHGALFEKYDVVARKSAVGRNIRYGYHSNEVGFGWTNGVALELWNDLPAARRPLVKRLGGIGAGKAARPVLDDYSSPSPVPSPPPPSPPPSPAPRARNGAMHLP